MSTIHNPVNFKPEDYSVVGYFDNQPPAYCGGSMVVHEMVMADWRSDRQRLFPDGQNVHRCGHCGNGTVRYIAACLHAPTGQNVVFGDVCVDRLGFSNHDKFAAERIRSRAAAAAKAAKLYAAKLEFLTAHPELVPVVTAVDAGQVRNVFVCDVIRKLSQYGSLSDRQVEAVLSSTARDAVRAGQQAARLQACEKAISAGVRAPSGRQTVSGKVLSTRLDEGPYGVQRKMLVELADGVRVWSTVPSQFGEDILGQSIQLTATFQPKEGDPMFAFASRPRVSVVSSTQQQPEPELAEMVGAGEEV